MEADSTHPAHFWSARIQRVRRFINAGWFIESILPVLFFASVATTVLILVSRRQGWSATPVIVTATVLGLAALVVALVRARRHFISEVEARTRIESGLHLHSRLGAAAAGVGSWPPVDQWRPALWRWHWRKLAVLPLSSAALLIAALLLPILPSATDAARPPIAKPPALEQVESILDKLAATSELDQPGIEALREEARQLASQDPAEWYSHASLEASDHLKAKLNSGLKALGDQTAKLEKLLGQNPSEANAAWDSQLQGALSALQGNIPGLNNELAKALAGLDPAKFTTVPPEQLEQLKEGLRNAQKAAGKCKNPGDGSDEEGEGEDGGSDGDNGLGNGGVDRGPGTGPVRLGNSADLETKKTDAVGSRDLSRAALGDAVGMSAGQHDTDKTLSHRSAVGGVIQAGEGAGPTWQQQNLTPEERKRLQVFFK